MEIEIDLQMKVLGLQITKSGNGNMENLLAII